MDMDMNGSFNHTYVCQQCCYPDKVPL